jgi:hypothetical protein
MMTTTAILALSMLAAQPQQARPPFGGPMGGPELKLVKRFDQDGNGWLNAGERAEARKAARNERAQGRPSGGFRGPGGPGGRMAPGSSGPKISPDEVKVFKEAELFDTRTLRTFFLQFENADWESELEDFHNTDVDVPATVTVDGVRYPNVGVRFRGASSYMMVPAGNKRSLNLAFDMADAKQRVYGAKTLNFLNSNGDPSFLSTVLYSEFANKHIPAPRANHVKVAINGESWGVYVSVEQFNNDFVTARFPAKVNGKSGARWKVSGSPNGDGGLAYLGEALGPYKQRYEIKSKDNEDDWRALIQLCKTLSETPTNQLEAALEPILDLDGVLWFLALDIGLLNSDGYWVRASDYSLYRDPKGVFHVIPHDMNEAFRAEGGRGPGGPGGFRGGPPPGGGFPGGGAPGGPPPMAGGGFDLDPFTGMDDVRKPLRSRLLAVPSLRAKYIANLKTLADESLDWSKSGPLVARLARLIEPEVRADTRKNSTYEAFLMATRGANGQASGLQRFFDARRAVLERVGGES